MNKRLGWLIGISLLLWLIVSYPAFRWGGEPALVFSAVAAGLCLFPSVLTFLWASWARHRSPEQQLAMVLGGTAVRMVFVLSAAMFLNSQVAYFQQDGFWVWILIFYLATLALEVVLLVSGQSANVESPSRLPEPEGSSTYVTTPRNV